MLNKLRRIVVIKLSKIIYTSLFIFSSVTFSQMIPTANEQKVDRLFSQYTTKDSPGAAIVIVKDGKIILKKEYGMADLENDIPITSSTVFHIGSVSKQFTGYSILLLEQQGKLNLNDDIRKYLPELPGFTSKITIRHLLNHTSGLRDNESLFALCGISTADTYSNDNSMELVKHQRELNFNPGNEIAYCNTGFILAAEIIERITGKTLRDWTTKNIFQPLGMTNTQFNDDNTRIIKHFAPSYWEPDRTLLAKGILNSSNVGSTGIITTTDDIAKWLIHFGDPKVGGKTTMNKLLTDTCFTNNGELVDYSYGIAVTKHEGIKVNFHSGSDAGYKAFNAYFPEYNFGVAVLSNFLSINAEELGFKIADIYLEDKLIIEPTAEKQKVEQTTPNSNKVENYALSNKELKNYQGKYFSDELETQYTVVFRGDTLVMKHIRNGEILLVPISADKFAGQFPMMMVDIQFIRDKKNNIEGFTASTRRARNIFFKRL